MPTREELAEIARKELARERARAVLLANKEIPFVRRMLNPQDYPALWSEEGVPRTVRLGSYGFDGTSWVVPEIAYQGGQLIEGSGGEWARGQIDRGNAIAFANAALADEFARGEDSWKALFKSRGGDLIDDRIERPTPPDPPGRIATPLETALYQAMSNRAPVKASPLTPGSWPSLP